MKPSILDTDILSEFLRGNPKVIAKVDEHLKEYGFINLSIITYYEILMAFCTRMPENNLTVGLRNVGFFGWKVSPPILLLSKEKCVAPKPTLLKPTAVIGDAYS
jgi:hypothetical protein